LEYKLLRKVLYAAKTWTTIADDFRDASGRMHFFLKEDRRGPGRALDDSQEQLLLKTARSKPGWDAAFYAAMVAANTTMRGCEIKGLQLEDINLMAREVYIRRSKTATGVRRIPLNDGALWAFARLIERAGALGASKPEHYLFPRFLYRETKTIYHATGYDPTRHQKTWRSAWRSLVTETARRAGREAARQTVQAGRGWRSGIASWRGAAAQLRGLRFHDLRHTAITKLAESEASDQTIMSIADHLDRAMLEHHSHIRATAKRKAVEAIRSYIPEEAERPIIKTVQ
jgi:integrase